MYAIGEKVLFVIRFKKITPVVRIDAGFYDDEPRK
jgi:hypothetical protein